MNKIINIFCVKKVGQPDKTMTDVPKKGINMENQYIQIAITLARLYGIAETLEPWEYLANDEFLQIIDEWTQEFQCTREVDILSFFEGKVADKTQEQNNQSD